MIWSTNYQNHISLIRGGNLFKFVIGASYSLNKLITENDFIVDIQSILIFYYNLLNY